MKIPKKVVKDNSEYEFMAVIKDNMYLYENIKTKARMTFDNFDLGLLDNSKIDKKLNIKEQTIYKYIVYDRMEETEKEYDDIHKIANELECTANSVRNNIRERKWLYNRYFVERIDI